MQTFLAFMSNFSAKDCMPHGPSKRLVCFDGVKGIGLRGVSFGLFHSNKPEVVSEVVPVNPEQLGKNILDPERVATWQTHKWQVTSRCHQKPYDHGVLCQRIFELAKWQGHFASDRAVSWLRRQLTGPPLGHNWSRKPENPGFFPRFRHSGPFLRPCIARRPLRRLT
jgi:hypothetical protein